MRRGEICLVDLEPARGSEADKRRPAIIVSNDGANSTAERIQRGGVTVHRPRPSLPGPARGRPHRARARLESPSRASPIDRRRASRRTRRTITGRTRRGTRRGPAAPPRPLNGSRRFLGKEPVSGTAIPTRPRSRRGEHRPAGVAATDRRRDLGSYTFRFLASISSFDYI